MHKCKFELCLVIVWKGTRQNLLIKTCISILLYLLKNKLKMKKLKTNEKGNILTRTTVHKKIFKLLNIEKNTFCKRAPGITSK